MSSKPKAIYFPIKNFVYDVGPGLHPLDYDFGNGDLDGRIIQIDDEFSRYRAEKIAARKEDLTKYFGLSRLDPAVEKAAVYRLLEVMTGEWPEHFNLSGAGSEIRTLICKLTGEELDFDSGGKLTAVRGQKEGPSYEHAIDALISQLQEDFAIVSTKGEENWLSAGHIAFPSHWDPRKKIGTDFVATHAPVPGFERMAKAHRAIIEGIVNKGPYVRFVWSFVTDTRLNHHPEAPIGDDPVRWKGRSFDESDPTRAPFSLRVERQVTVPLPQVGAALFFIRLSFIDGRSIRDDSNQRVQLKAALESMTPAAREYKGVAGCFDRLIGWLS